MFMHPGTVFVCRHCKKEIEQVEPEICWYCGRPLCGECWEIYGHCGHPEADLINEKQRKVNNVSTVSD